MARKTSTESQPIQALRTFALRYPETEEGVACEGTAIESRTIKARNKAFLFMGAAGIRLKLRESLAEAAKLAAKQPDRYKVGANGWVLVTLGDQSSPHGLLEKWIDESYRLLVPKQLVAMLPARGPPTAGFPEAQKKPTRKAAPR